MDPFAATLWWKPHAEDLGNRQKESSFEERGDFAVISYVGNLLGKASPQCGTMVSMLLRRTLKSFPLKLK